MSDPGPPMGSTTVDLPRTNADPFGLGPGDLVDRYTIIDRIGAGGMGVVYRARDPTLDRQIALKLVRADLRADGTDAQDRLLREAQAMAQVSHPNVLPIYDVGIVGMSVFIAMELIEGEGLQGWRLGQPREPDRIVDVFIGAGLGLAAVHEAGLVHRDFKPSNVLIDHRVLVMDFGLARATGASTARSRSQEGSLASASHPLSTQLTHASVMIGTPAYMAPEQMLREDEVDERADQFAFCVTLFEMLFGRRPFAKDTLVDLYRAKSLERWIEVEPPCRLTRRLLPIVHRGLAARPEDRWPSMLALVDALRRARAPASWSRRLVGGGALFAVGSLVVVLALPEPPSPCETDDGLAGVWDPSARQAVHEAWQGSDVPYWERAWAKIAPRLDAYASAWQVQHREVCEANRRPGTDDPALLDRRSHCLDDARRHLAALARTLERSDPGIVETAATAVAALPRIERCEDPRYLAADVQPPETPEQAAVVAGLRQELALAEALAEADLLDEALAQVRDVSTAAAALDYAPLQAMATVKQGRLLLRHGTREQAGDALTRGYFAAREQGLDEIALEAAIGLIEISRGDSRFEDGMQWARTAEALLLAVGDEPARRAEVLTRKGALLSDMGRVQQASETLERALDLELHVFGDADPRVALTRLALGTALRAQPERLDQALVVLRRALATAESAYDPTHPTVSKFHTSLGNALVMAGRLDDALSHYEQAEAISRAAFGDQDPKRAGFMISRSQIYMRRNELDRAEALTSEALALWETAHGKEHPLVALALNNLGVIAENKGEDRTALALYRRSLRIYQQVLGPDHRTVIVIHRNLGEVLLRLGERAEAREQLEQIMALAEDHDLGADDVAMARFGLARIRWEEGGERGVERVEARRQVEIARAALEELGPSVGEELEVVTDWLAEHPAL